MLRLSPSGDGYVYQYTSMGELLHALVTFYSTPEFYYVYILIKTSTKLRHLYLIDNVT